MGLSLIVWLLCSSLLISLVTWMINGVASLCCCLLVEIGYHNL